jgi:Protein of unknown function (DUF1552)
MMKSWHISRRTLLQGVGAAVALPFLEAMRPALAVAALGSKKLPTRMAFVYVPNGVNMKEWTPTATGADFELPAVLEPLKPFQQDLQVLTGLTCDKARPNGDGAGDHARAMSAFLTGSQPRKTSGADIKAGISVDQIAALKAGGESRFSSLEIGCDRGLQSGNCDSGYSCAYSANLSWRSDSTPMPKEVDPKLLFERLFSSEIKGEVDANRAKRDRYNKSILDFVAEDALSLKAKLGPTDQRKLDEYFTTVRELELRIQRASTQGPEKPPPGVTKPSGVPKDFQEHIRLMTDLLVLAFQGDLTRIATFVYANEGSNRPYKFIGVPEGHHELSHHGGDKAKLEKITKINRFHMTQFASLLEKLKNVEEGDGTLLDNCMIMYGSGNSDGNRHNHDDLPILLAGKGGGTLKTGRHVRYRRETPLTNLFLSMLERMGAPTASFGDSTGKLDDLAG